MGHDIFISYSTQDEELANQIVSELEKHDLKCWIASRDARIGKAYSESIVNAIHSSRMFLLVLTQSSAQSRHVIAEINSAFNDQNVDMFPLLFDSTPIAGSLEYYLGHNSYLPQARMPEVIELILRQYEQAGTDGKTARATPASNIISTASAKARGQLTMCTFEDLLELGYTAESIACKLVENDYITCNGILYENEGTAAQWEAFLEGYSETFRYLISVDSAQIIGNWSITALTIEELAEARAGSLFESNLDFCGRPFLLPGTYDGYVLALSLLPKYRSTKNYTLLIDTLLDQIQEYAEEGIFFRSWTMNTFNPRTEAIVKGFGFEHCAANNCSGQVYHLDVRAVNKAALTKHPQLVELYRRFFSEDDSNS